MQNPETGRFDFLTPDLAETLNRIFRAGNRTLPIFKEGEVLEIKNGRFEVIAIDGYLMVLRGLPASVEVVLGDAEMRG